MSGAPRLDRPFGLRFVGDPGAGNLNRVCCFLAHQLSETTPGAARSLIQTGDAGVENMHALGRREVDVALVTPSAVATLAQRGEGPFAAGGGYPFLRAIAELPHPDRLVLAVKPELGVSSVAELRERQAELRLTTALDEPGASFIGYATERVLEAAGLAPEAVRAAGGEVVSQEMPPRCLAELDRGANAVFHEAVMTPWWHDAVAKHELVVLPFEEELLASAERELACPPETIPAGYLPGMEEAVRTVGFEGYLVVVRNDLPDDVAALLTWILGATNEMFIAMNYGHLDPERSPVRFPIETAGLARVPIPLHDGAAAAYERELGLDLSAAGS